MTPHIDETSKRISGTRINVYDVMDYLGHRDEAYIREMLSITPEEYRVAVEYIENNREKVEERHRYYKELYSKGEPPEIEAMLAESRKRVHAKVAELKRLKQIRMQCR